MGIARDDHGAVATCEQDDARVDYIPGLCGTAQHARCFGLFEIQGTNGKMPRADEPSQPYLPGTIAPDLRHDAGRDVHDSVVLDRQLD
ncbi:MAG: hypothetical protein ACRDZO_17300 [Egibacteraceae bacterium]